MLRTIIRSIIWAVILITAYVGSFRYSLYLKSVDVDLPTQSDKTLSFLLIAIGISFFIYLFILIFEYRKKPRKRILKYMLGETIAGVISAVLFVLGIIVSTHFIEKINGLPDQISLLKRFEGSTYPFLFMALCSVVFNFVVTLILRAFQKSGKTIQVGNVLDQLDDAI
jgi:hypothetical protein